MWKDFVDKKITLLWGCLLLGEFLNRGKKSKVAIRKAREEHEAATEFGIEYRDDGKEKVSSVKVEVAVQQEETGS